jgi:plasmid stabilization system protein ParE
MKLVLSSEVKSDLAEAERYYEAISGALASDFRAEAAATVRTILQRGGGDHIGPHGFPCRRCVRFPYVIYYEAGTDVLRVLGIIHERRHPDYLKLRLE